jgi:spore germination protein KC
MRLIVLLLIPLLFLPLSGCWDQVELEKVGLVVLMGIDTDPLGDGFEVTIHLLSPGNSQEGAGGTNAPTVVLSGRGGTILDATRNLRGRVPALLSFHHVRIIVVGEDLARKGLAPVLDFLIRTPEIRLGSYMIIAQGSARDILSIRPKVTTSLNQELEGLILAQDQWSKGTAPPVFEFVKDYLDGARQPVTARVLTIDPRIPPDNLREPQGQNAEGPGQEGEHEEVVLLQGSAVFRDDRLVGWLTGTETMAYRLLTGERGEFLLVVPWRGARVSLEISVTSSNLEYIRGSQPPRFHHAVSLNARVMEYTGYTLFSAARLRQLQNLAADSISDLLRNGAERAKELDSDILGYGTAISHQDPTGWRGLKKDWRKTFPASQTEIDVIVHLVHTNMLRGPLPPEGTDD